MWLELTPFWIALLNFLGIPAAHLGLSWLFTRMPDPWFEHETLIFQSLAGESPKNYEQYLFIRRWKRHLPDAAPWFGGFAKRSISSTDPAYFRTFIRETRRGEAAHLAQMIVIISFVLWTPWPWATIIIAWALASNLPCLLLQRYNRLRFLKHLALIRQK